MSADLDAKPVLLRFFDNFLQERNIKWLLALGTLIVLASSVMLVSTHWGEASYTPFWKYLTLIAYAAGIHLVAQWAYHRACLRKTGTVLMALTVFLAPLTFLALRWVQTDSKAGLFDQGINVGLLVLNFALVLAAVDRVFRHFLRGRQVTFLASFLGLCLAGAVLPGIDWSAHPQMAAGTSLLLWGMFAAGTIKVNRHVFWLTESRQALRIFGFFPMLLLGGQFLGLFAWNFASHIELQWIGLGCVLTAIPILLASDQIAAIFQQRTGNLVRPLPWPIVLPFGAGLLMTVVGIFLSGLDLRPPHVVSLALVPTAALAAIVMGLVARRTGHQSFVWGMLVLVVLAYNFSYVFFQETARVVVTQGAVAVREARLPLAFYGLTYVPLLATLTAGAVFARRRHQPLFAETIQIFCVGLATTLLALACTNIKAMLPVGVVLLILFAVQTVAFRARPLILLAIAAWFVAAFGAAPFGEHVLRMPLPPDTRLVLLVLAATALWIPGFIVDRFVRTLPVSPALERGVLSVVWDRPCEVASVIGSIVLALCCIGWFVVVGGSPALWLAAALLIALLFAHSLHKPEMDLGPLVYGFTAITAISYANSLATVTISTMLSLATWMLLAQWCVTYGLALRPQQRVSVVYLPTLQWTSLVGLTTAAIGVSLVMVCETCLVPASLLPIECGWIIRLLLLAWTFDAARRHLQPVFAVLGAATLFAIASSLLMQSYGATAFMWLPVAWSLVAVVGIIVIELMRRRLASLGGGEQAVQRRRELHVIVKPLGILFPIVQACIVVGTWQLLAWPLRWAAVIALASLLGLARVRHDRFLAYFSIAMLNWHALVALTAWICPDVAYFPLIFVMKQHVVGVPLAFASALSVLAWHWSPRDEKDVASGICVAQQNILRITAAAGLWLSLTLPGLTPLYAVLAAATFALVVIAELLAACRDNDESRVWWAEIITLIGVGYLFYFKQITFGHGRAMYAVLFAGVVTYVMGLLVRRSSRTVVLSGPFERTGYCLPLLTVVIGVGRNVFDFPSYWLGMNSLALLLVAGFYCYHAIERRKPISWLLSATSLNIALMLLWRELAFSDPQFYLVPIGISVLGLVQLLKREIPAEFHDALRYLGALMILVSPTWNIVGGSWLHMITLLIAAVAIVLVAIGLRVRALLYTGAAFLLADLVAMIVRGSFAHPNLLWIVGLGVGASVVALGAFCENHRELLEQRLRLLSASLKQWD